MVAEYIKKLLSVEEYSFSLQELGENCSKDLGAIRRELSRLIEKGEIINLRKEYYLILPPRYSEFGKLPAQLYSEKLFNFLERRYYIGLFTAAKFHGASHQQIHRDYFIIEPPKLINIQKGNIDIQFHTTVTWPLNNILIRQSDAGPYQISSPTLTFVDLIHYHTKLGGINRILPILEELAEEITTTEVAGLVKWYSSKSTLQRVGFFLDRYHSGECSDIIYNHLSRDKIYPVLLSPRPDQKAGRVANRWKVDLNLELEHNF